MIKISTITNKLSFAIIKDITRICLICLVDTRLNEQMDNLCLESKDVITNMIKGLNMIILRLASGVSNGIILRVMLQLLLACTNTIDVMSHKLSQPCLRLLLHVLSDESNQPNPFTMPSVNSYELMNELHDFYSKHPIHLQEQDNDQPFRGAKTVLHEVRQTKLSLSSIEFVLIQVMLLYLGYC